MSDIQGRMKNTPKLQGHIKFGNVYPELEDLVVTPNEEEQNFKSDKYGYNEVKVKAIETENKTAVIDFSNSDTVEVNSTSGKYIKKVTINKDEDLVANNVKQGANIYGIKGNVIELVGQTKQANPAITAQTIVPDEGFNALTSVDISEVTSDIDSNIRAENIKQGVTILGVEGALELGTDTSDATATASELLEGYTAYGANGKLYGTMSDTGMVRKVYTASASGYDLGEITPSKVLSIGQYGIAFTDDGKYCVRLETINSEFYLCLYEVVDNVLVSLGANYVVSNNILTISIYSGYITGVRKFEMVTDIDQPHKCSLYIEAVGAQSIGVASIVPIDFESDTPIVVENVIQLSTDTNTTSIELIMIPTRLDRCFVWTDNSYYQNMTFYLASIDYENKRITALTDSSSINVYSGIRAQYSFSQDGRSMLISKHLAVNADGSNQAAYIVRLRADYETFKTTQITNANAGFLCLNFDGTLAFTNGKLFSIAYDSNENVSFSRIGTANVIEPFNYNAATSTHKPYFTIDNSKIIVASNSTGIKEYNIDLTGESTAEGIVLSTINSYFCCQDRLKRNVYAMGEASAGRLFAVKPNNLKEDLTSLIYNNQQFVDVNLADPTSIDADIIPENIKQGVDILGVVGTLTEGTGGEGGENILDVTDNDTISIEGNTLIIGGTE